MIPSHVYNFKYSTNHIKKVKKYMKAMSIISYLREHTCNMLSFQHDLNPKTLVRCSIFLFFCSVSESRVYSTLKADLNLELPHLGAHCGRCAGQCRCLCSILSPRALSSQSPSVLII